MPKKLKAFWKRNMWLLLGLASLLVACVVAADAIPAKPASDTFRVFTADGSFATLAGFTVLAIALERLCEAVLAPWWAKTKASEVKTAAEGASDKVKAAAQRGFLGASDLTTVAQVARAAAAAPEPETDTDTDTDEQAAAKEAAAATADAAESAWVKVARDRPTIVLPAAAIATVACAHLHLFLLHGISKAGGTGVPNTELSYVIDALITGLALAGGAKPFHDLVESLAAKKQTAVATAASSPAASSPPASPTGS